VKQLGKAYLLSMRTGGAPRTHPCQVAS
jgi:hypothetical protein